MNTKDNTTRNIVIILMIVAAAAFRLLAFKYKDLSNFNPVGAIALFGGAYFASKWKSYATVLFTLFTTDIVLNYRLISEYNNTLKKFTMQEARLLSLHRRPIVIFLCNHKFFYTY